MKYPTHDASALLHNGKFTDGDAGTALPPSPDRADYQNAVYDELLAVIVAGGLTPDFSDRTQLKQAIIAMFQRDVVPAGKVDLFDRTIAPSGWWEMDGRVYLIADQPALASATYCGNGDNDTADYNYRCTDPENPATSRSTEGAYQTLRDARGYFPRFWSKDSADIDAGRSFYALQDDAMQDHAHIVGVGSDGDVGTRNANWGYTPRDAIIRGASSGHGGQSFQQSSTAKVAGAWPAAGDTPNYPASARNAVETRPKNMPFLACIKL